MTARCTLTSWDSVPDDVRETQNHDNRMAELDARDEYADLLLAMDNENDFTAYSLWLIDGGGLEPEPDHSRYATEAEYYDLGGLLASPCMPSSYCTADELPANAALDPVVAAEMRARIRRRAAA